MCSSDLVELSWSDARTGMQIRDATEYVLREKPRGEIEVVYTFGPKEYWYLHSYHAVNTLTGKGGTELQGVDQQLDCRPHSFWLSILQGRGPELSHLNFIRKREYCQLYRSEDGKRIRIQNGAMVFEFAVESDYCPVLFETNMNVQGVPQGGKKPIRETYEVAQDAHGVWYCKSMVRSRWKQGLDKDPLTRHVATIVEYDSDPPPERMRLDYKSIGARSDTMVTSFIPGRSGSWKYGKGAAGENSGEEDALRQSSQRLRERGFAKEPEVQP